MTSMRLQNVSQAKAELSGKARFSESAGGQQVVLDVLTNCGEMDSAAL